MPGLILPVICDVAAMMVSFWCGMVGAVARFLTTHFSPPIKIHGEI